MDINIKVPQTVNVTKMKIFCKCADTFSYSIYTDNKCIQQAEGYVPSFMPGDKSGDYIDLTIDVNTGQIIGWDPKKFAQAFQEIINSQED